MTEGLERNAGSPRSPYSTRYVWYVILLLTFVNVFNTADRMALAMLTPLVKADLGLSDAELGLLTGLAFAIFYALCGLPIARWADRGVRRNIIVMALATWSAMTALCGAAQNFWQLFLARMGVGVGEAGGVVPAQSVLCDYVPPERRPGVFAIHTVGLILGLMFGLGFAGLLGESIGWRWTFAVLGLPGIVVAILVRLTLREPVRGLFDARKDDPRGVSFRQAVQYLRQCKTYRRIIVFNASQAFIYYALTQWLPSFYMRASGVDSAIVGVYLGVAIGAGQGLGMLIGGFAAHRSARYGVRVPLIMSAGALALALPALTGALLVSSVFASMFLVSLSTLFWGVSVGPLTATLYGIVSSGMRATAGAISILFVSGVGYSLGPLYTGLLSDILAPSFGLQSLRYALLGAVGLIPLAVFALYAVVRALPDDSEAAKTARADSAIADRSAARPMVRAVMR